MASILEARCKTELISRFKTAIQRAGFETFVIALEHPCADGACSYHVTSDYALDWQHHYQHSQYALTDPTVKHCQRSVAPLVWSETLFQRADALHMLEEASAYGISHGISIATHAGQSKTMISLVRDKPFTQNGYEQAHLLATAKLLAACISHAGTQLLIDQPSEPPLKPLTAREREILQWIAQGKSSWEIAAILSVAEATIAFHVKNLMRKLGVHNRQQALVMALRMGLIS